MHKGHILETDDLQSLDFGVGAVSTSVQGLHGLRVPIHRLESGEVHEELIALGLEFGGLFKPRRVIQNRRLDRARHDGQDKAVLVFDEGIGQSFHVHEIVSVELELLPGRLDARLLLDEPLDVGHLHGGFCIDRNILILRFHEYFHTAKLL